ncbi:MAG: tetratricopeptide repeat protein [Candidatus Krumholzibacteriia bacterium]
MSLIGKLLGRHEDDPYAQGIALFDAGRYAEAAEALRGAAQKRRRSAAGNLAAFYQLQALTREGRRLLRAGQAAAASPFLAEAVAGWERYPDLHALLGLAQAQAGRWPEALHSATEALRCNPDYVEARLLEAAALRRLGRAREAAASLDKLVESGRRIDHPLIAALKRAGGYDADSLPDDLEARLEHLATGPEPGGEVATAVALCRAGRWEEGVENLRALCAERPDYPDYRLKLGAALYQLGRNDEALAELAHALDGNPHYHTAAHLKALVLADQGRFAAAREVLAAHPPQAGSVAGNPHEALFSAYLSAVLALLGGCPGDALAALADWEDLTLTFPRGELVRAAAEDLLARPDAAGRRLAALATAWPGDADYQHLHVCHLLRSGDLAAAERALSRWPAAGDQEADPRPLLLTTHLTLARGRAVPAPPLDAAGSGDAAWRFLAVRSLAQRGQWAEALAGAATLWREGWRTERVALVLLGAANAVGDLPADLVTDRWEVSPESAVPLLLPLWIRSGRGAEAEALCARHRELHGEDLRWTWLWPPFWLEPVRRWIG